MKMAEPFALEKDVCCRKCGAREILPESVPANTFRLQLRAKGWLLSVYAVICPNCIAADRLAD
jgi:hypothetical protein